MRTIKKYGNRRLYDTQDSRYLNLDELAGLIRAGEQVQVVDAKTSEDLTRGVLLQLLLEVQGGSDLFPVGLLHRLIRFGGDSQPQRLMMRQVATGLELLDTQIARMEGQFGWMFAGAQKPSAPPPAAAQPEPPPEEEEEHTPPPAAPPRSKADADLDAMRARLAALEERLKRGN